MAEENKVNAQTANTQPEDNGAGKTFTQDEVNRIVSERLARERAKNDSGDQTPDPVTEREKQITIRENKIACKEYLHRNNYPQQLLEVFDTDNETKFKENVERLHKAFPAVFEPIYNAVRETNGSITDNANDTLAAIFKPKH